MIRSLLSIAYGAVVNRRNRRFDDGRRVVRSDLPVISVGNVSSGGTGKTPFVVLLTSLLRREGLVPAVVSRGYGRRSRGVVTVADHHGLHADVHSAGDELRMLARSLPGTVVIAAEQRILGCRRVEREYPDVDVIVLDDGFQHRQLFRDLDIVLVDSPTLARPHLMPVGVLREPLSGLRRASLVVCPADVDTGRLRTLTDAPVIRVHSLPAGWFTLEGRPCAAPSRAVLLTSIAHAERVVTSCHEQRVELVHHAEYRDHYFYRAQDVEAIVRRCRDVQCTNIVTTEKDAPKLEPFADLFRRNGIEVAVLAIRTVFVGASDEDLLCNHIRSLFPMRP